MIIGVLEDYFTKFDTNVHVISRNIRPFDTTFFINFVTFSTLNLIILFSTQVFENELHLHKNETFRKIRIKI